MRRCVLAYPYDPPPTSVIAAGGTVTVANCDGWPGAISGLDPCEADPADLAEELARIAGPSDLIVPMCEEAVTAVAAAAARVGAAAVSRHAARACVDRRELRRRLAHLAVNPAWCVDRAPTFTTPWIVKAAASCASDGVVRVEEEDELELAVHGARLGGGDHVRRLQILGPVDYSYLVESYVPPPRYEVSGIVANGATTSFRPLRQVWRNPGHLEVERYEPADQTYVPRLQELASRVVDAIGLDWCMWNVEVSGPPWVVIEVHARWGWEDWTGDSPDRGYWSAHCRPVNPMVEAAEAITRAWRWYVD